MLTSFGEGGLQGWLLHTEACTPRLQADSSLPLNKPQLDLQQVLADPVDKVSNKNSYVNFTITFFDVGKACVQFYNLCHVAVHGRGKSVPSQWITLGCVEAC